MGTNIFIHNKTRTLIQNTNRKKKTLSGQKQPFWSHANRIKVTKGALKRRQRPPKEEELFGELSRNHRALLNLHRQSSSPHPNWLWQSVEEIPGVTTLLDTGIHQQYAFPKYQLTHCQTHHVSYGVKSATASPDSAGGLWRMPIKLNENYAYASHSTSKTNKLEF